MLSFLHPYVAVIIDFIKSIDDFMEKNGGEFNSYVLSIMLIVIGYAKFIQKAKKAKGLNQKNAREVGIIRRGELIVAVENANRNRMRDCILRLGTTDFHEDERGKGGSADELFRETDIPRDVDEK